MAEPDPSAGNYTPACPQFAPPVHTKFGGKFPWSRNILSLVLYSFFIGYTLSQIPGGWFADKFGARPVILFSVFCTTLCTVAFPICTEKWGYVAAVILRFLIGMSHGFCMPCISSMVSTWYPPVERPKWGGLAFAGTNLGNIMGNMITGVLIQSFNWWPVAFYFWASYSGLFFFLVLLLLYSYPDTHPFISKEEADFIRENTMSTVPVKRSLRTPWKAILLNAPYWANVAAQFGHNYIYFTLVTFLPTYMREILRFDVSSDGFVSAAPFLALWLTSLVLSATAALFIKCTSEWFFNCVFGAGSNVASAFLALAAVYAGCNRLLCISFYIVSMIFKAFYYVTLPVNINRLSKKYGGFMFGLCNSMGSISGIISSAIIGSVTKHKQLHEWRFAFWITLGVSVVTTIIFALFSSAKRQEFDYEEDEPRET
ncbi:hypothetical protein ABEB36_009013 [Hypothenemus hampei]|uniref:Major facilitator superfamily (MFS) profile domain-containing protein n=1 Tax=Hypothenemus hampei TaxID=57062 RepID=A0ABD1EP93_HYPHA